MSYGRERWVAEDEARRAHASYIPNPEEAA